MAALEADMEAMYDMIDRFGGGAEGVAPGGSGARNRENAANPANPANPAVCVFTLFVTVELKVHVFI